MLNYNGKNNKPTPNYRHMIISWKYCIVNMILTWFYQLIKVVLISKYRLNI